MTNTSWYARNPPNQPKIGNDDWDSNAATSGQEN